MNLCDSDEDDAEPMELCDSDEDDAPAQQPARAAGSSKPAAQTVAQTAAQASEAKRRNAVVPAAKQAKQMQCPEKRQLGIRDPPPPKLSGSNALLSSLAKGANRVSSLLHKSHTMSASMSSRHLVAAFSPANFSYHAVHLAQLNTRVRDGTGRQQAKLIP